MAKKTTFVAYWVTGEGEQQYWNRVDSAWKHDKGNGFNIQLFATPIDCKIVLIDPTEDKSSSNNEQVLPETWQQAFELVAPFFRSAVL